MLWQQRITEDWLNNGISHKFAKLGNYRTCPKKTSIFKRFRKITFKIFWFKPFIIFVTLKFRSSVCLTCLCLFWWLPSEILKTLFNFYKKKINLCTVELGARLGVCYVCLFWTITIKIKADRSMTFLDCTYWYMQMLPRSYAFLTLVTPGKTERIIDCGGQG